MPKCLGVRRLSTSRLCEVRRRAQILCGSKTLLSFVKRDKGTTGSSVPTLLKYGVTFIDLCRQGEKDVTPSKEFEYKNYILFAGNSYLPEKNLSPTVLNECCHQCLGS